MNARRGLRGYLPNNASTPVLLAYASVLALAPYPAMLLLRRVPGLDPHSFIVGDSPVVAGCITMGLCSKARQKSNRRTAMMVYTVLLALFAFYYPIAWIYFLYMTATGQYHGPYP
jgi:hypothetical protein